MLRIRHHDEKELSHYSAATADLEFAFPWGWGELEGVANRTDYDLRVHAGGLGRAARVLRPVDERALLPVRDRACARCHPGDDGVSDRRLRRGRGRWRGAHCAAPRSPARPYQVAVLPLSKKDTLEPLAREVLKMLQAHFMCDYDTTQSIGQRYRRQDEVGTPWCVTVDFDSLEDNAVTVRDRDTTEQVRVPVDGLVAELSRRAEATAT